MNEDEPIEVVRATVAKAVVDALIAAGWRSPDEVARQVAAARQEGREQAAQAIEATNKSYLTEWDCGLLREAARLARGSSDQQEDE